jgi:hypothetical protein
VVLAASCAIAQQHVLDLDGWLAEYRVVSEQALADDARDSVLAGLLLATGPMQKSRADDAALRFHEHPVVSAAALGCSRTAPSGFATIRAAVAAWWPDRRRTGSVERLQAENELQRLVNGALL